MFKDTIVRVRVSREEEEEDDDDEEEDFIVFGDAAVAAAAAAAPPDRVLATMRTERVWVATRRAGLAREAECAFCRLTASTTRLRDLYYILFSYFRIFQR